MTALALACRLILYCHGSHVADVVQAIEASCRGVRDRQTCRAALVITAHNETRWYLSESAMRFSPFGLTAYGYTRGSTRRLYSPGNDYIHAAHIAWDILTHGLRRCGSWPRAFAWFVRGEQNGRCPPVGPESRQRWRQMRRLLRR